MGQKATTLDEQITILKERNMVINDIVKAKEILFDIGYYRLGFYWFPFEKTYPNKRNRDHFLRKILFLRMRSNYIILTSILETSFLRH